MTKPNCCPPASRSATRETGVAWPLALRALRTYERRYGTVDVPPRIRAYGIELGRCVARCRADFWNGQLAPDAVSALESLPGWSWGEHPPGSWRIGLVALTRHARRTGTTIMVRRTVVDGVDLQQWCAEQRTALATHRLSANQIESLEALPGWQWDPAEHRWQQGLAALDAYVQSGRDRGDIHPSTRIGDFPLGFWLERCRADCRTNTLSAERQAALESAAGWNCCPSAWVTGYHALQQYLAEHGHANPTQDTVIDDFRLGWWVTRQRQRQRRGSLYRDHQVALEALPGWMWNPLALNATTS